MKPFTFIGGNSPEITNVNRKCPKCTLITTDIKKLKAHMKTDHNVIVKNTVVNVPEPSVSSNTDTDLHKCPRCTLRSSLSGIQAHLKSDHGILSDSVPESDNSSKLNCEPEKSLPRKCPMCTFVTSALNELEEHLKTEHKVTVKNSSNVNVPTIATDDTNKTSESEEEAEDIFCNYCQSRFDTISKYRCHSFHCNFDTQIMEKVCWGCKTSFQDIPSLVTHIASCQVDDLICCILCPMKFVLMDDLSKHITSTHNYLCLPVEDIDFEQAINRAPYILKRKHIAM